MLTVACLDWDRHFAETLDGPRPRLGKPAPTSDVEARLRALRAIVGQARGRAIRPRRARLDGA